VLGNLTSTTIYTHAKAVVDYVASLGFITSVITALGYTPANKAGDTFTGAISATNLSGTNTGDETLSTLGTKINGATTATPNDTDLVPTVESSLVKKITWSNVKAFFKAYFDTIYTTTSAVATQISTALTGYATQAWVTAQNYLTNSSLKTVNGNSLVGSGNIDTSENFIQTILSKIGNLFTTTYVSGDYSYTGTLTPTFNTSSLTLTGASDGTNNTNIFYTKWFSGSENIVHESNVTVNSIGATHYGYAVLFENVLSSTEFRITIGTATAFNAGILNILLNTGSVATATMSTAPRIGDVINVKVTLNANVISAVVTNVNLGISNTMSYTMDYNAPINYFKGLSKFGFGFYGGNLTNVTWSVKTDDYYNADLMIVGDSKGLGLGVPIANRLVQLWRNANVTKNIYTNSGGNDVSQSFIDKLPEILLYKPKVVVIIAPSNDPRTSVSTATTISRITTVRNALTAIGCDVWYQNPIPELSGLDQSGLVTVGTTVFPSNRIIPVPPTFNTTTDLVADNVHINTGGYVKVYNNQATYIALDGVTTTLQYQMNNNSWFSSNASLILKLGEPAYHINGTYKIGDGVTALSALPWLGSASDLVKVYTTIDFGNNPINEKSFTITDSNCLTTSKIDIDTYYKSQIEENFGVQLDLFTECFNGSFNIVAIARYPVYEVKGQFNIKYKINN
jgi:hypothetical protein